MSHHDEVLGIIKDAEGDLSAAAEVVYKTRTLAIYAILIGLQTLMRKKRATRRRELRSEVQPQFKPGRVTGSVVLTEPAKKRLLSITQRLFGDDGWMIGEINLGVMTKEGLLAQAQSERASAHGSLRNAEFYEALAAPLQPGQLVKVYWRPEEASEVRGKIWKDTESRRAALR